MLPQKDFEIWFVTGSQHLYGPETLKLVANHSQIMAEGFNNSPHIPVSVVYKPVLTTSDSIRELCLEANSSRTCIGLITWMHTFSPAKMWIAGLNLLKKPFVHLHTQFNQEIPWAEIDMDFINLKSICTWRPRIWLHRQPYASESQSGGWVLAGRDRPGRVG